MLQKICNGQYSIFNLVLIFLLVTISLFAQDSTDISFEAYDPTSTLVVPEHPTHRAKFPFVDIHGHQWNMPDQDLDKLTAQMDSLNMAVMVNLSGRSFHRVGNRFDIRGPEHLTGSMKNINAHYPKRFILFTNISLEGLGGPGWQKKTLKQLKADVAAGARGLKIYKGLGLNAIDADSQRVAVNDPRLDPVWAACGELGIPVLIHSADPRPFWLPHDKFNERWLELKLRPRRKRGPDNPVPWEQIINEQHSVFKKHPETIFINAHMGWMANDLGKLGNWLDEMPNMMVEFGAVIAELGRQPRHARAFFEKYQDRILFGKDAWIPSEFSTYFRVLETDDEYFPYHKKYHAFWRLYGLDLPDDVLKKVYYKNAIRIIPGIDASLFPG